MILAFLYIILKKIQIQTENLQYEHKLLSNLFRKSKILKENNETLKNHELYLIYYN